jgi:hypothetical protein
MAGHRPFSELRDKMSPERRRRVEARVAETLAEMAADEARTAAQQEHSSTAALDESAPDTAPTGASSFVPNVNPMMDRENEE